MMHNNNRGIALGMLTSLLAATLSHFFIYGVFFHA